MPRPAGPIREKYLFVRVNEKEHRLANVLAHTLGKSVQAMFLDLLTQGARALNVTVPDVVPENQLALAFASKRRPLRGPSRGGRGASGMGSKKSASSSAKKAPKTRGKRAGAGKPRKRAA